MRARRGISLFEAVAALAIVGVTAVSALAAVAADLRAAERAQRALEVESLVTERFVFLHLLTDRDLQNLPDSVSSGRFDPPFDEYTWTTTSAPSRDYAGLYDIRVVVEWPEGTYSATSAQYRRPQLVTRGRGR